MYIFSWSARFFIFCHCGYFCSLFGVILPCTYICIIGYLDNISIWWVESLCASECTYVHWNWGSYIWRCYFPFFHGLWDCTHCEQYICISLFLQLQHMVKLISSASSYVKFISSASSYAGPFLQLQHKMKFISSASAYAEVLFFSFSIMMVKFINSALLQHIYWIPFLQLHHYG